MGDLSPHFSRHEFACKDGCGFDTMDYATVQILEEVREHFGVPVTINSGCRCVSHNKAVGGASGSQHVYGRAVDIVVQGVAPSEVADWLERGPMVGRGGVGRYPSFTHVDSRTSGPARWSG